MLKIIYNMLNEYFCRIFHQITFPEYLGNVLRRRIFPAIISAEYFGNVLQ